eukprot:TRINITY_DN138_c0_g1_i5.p1 TRINITY_DN138_c0_g1~~TRINITY_DN138_c0_g1_i5.p1  ORF type:complete len:680 (+),score=156.34 TRINITY_DN138_c0_g1_i5:230-2269(+)
MPPKKKTAAPAADESTTTTTTAPASTGSTSTSTTSTTPLDGLVISICGSLSQPQAALNKLITSNGGTFSASVSKKTTHLVTTEEDAAEGNSKVDKAKEYGIHIVSEEFLTQSIAKGVKQNEADFDVSKATPGKKRKGDDAEEEAPKKKGKEKAEDSTVLEGKSAPVATETSTSSPSTVVVSAPPPPKDEGKKVKVTVKGRAAVDTYSGVASSAHVIEEGSTVYDCMLNQTNISQNNNKFYVIQALESDKGGQYWCFTRWGRVGEPGQKALQPCGSKALAIANFCKKFREKTVNDWNSRASFTPRPGKYTLIEIDYGHDEPEKPIVSTKGKEKAITTKSKLDPKVQELIKLIFDLKMMERTLVELEFDINKMPLGKLTKKQIKEGYEVLKEIDVAMKAGRGGSVLADLTSRFYTLIPHSFGRSIPPVIRTNEQLKSKMSMLEALADIEVATKLIKEVEDSGEDPIDASYAKLKCDIEPIEPGTDEYKQIQKYVANTHQGSVPKIKGLYRVNREGEKDRYEKGGKKLGNRKLLWHGSRLSNFTGILSQGLRIAPPEAPVSGYRFGKGLYFADIMSLSSIYCRSHGSNDFCMLLGDVALGKPAEVERDTYMEKPLPGSNSTWALGTIEPDPKDIHDHAHGYQIPSGKIVPSGRSGVSCREHQYIVYSVDQCHLQYLLHLNWV